MPVHNFVHLWCILLHNAAVQHPGKFARSCVGNTAAIVDGQVDDLPEWAFFNVGTLDDARKKAAEKGGVA